jgi:hypothetical protein
MRGGSEVHVLRLDFNQKEQYQILKSQESEGAWIFALFLDDNRHWQDNVSKNPS